MEFIVHPTVLEPGTGTDRPSALTVKHITAGTANIKGKRNNKRKKREEGSPLGRNLTLFYNHPPVLACGSCSSPGIANSITPDQTRRGRAVTPADSKIRTVVEHPAHLTLCIANSSQQESMLAGFRCDSSINKNFEQRLQTSTTSFCMPEPSGKAFRLLKGFAAV